MKSKKYLFLLVTIAMLIVSTCFIGVSYSFVSRTRTTNSTFSISTSNLSSNMIITSENRSLSILTDEEGVNQSSYAVIDITKDNDYSVFYNLTIGYSNNIPQGASYADLFPLEYVNVALFEMNGNNISSSPVSGPTKIGNLPIIKVDPSNKYNDMYNLFYATFNPNSQNAKYALKIWLDEQTPIYLDGMVVSLNLGINQTTKVSQSFYNFSGTIKDNNDSPLVGATISLLNGAINSNQNNYMPSKTVTGSNGSFTLYNVPTGTYTLNVTDGESMYETVIHVDAGNTISVTPTPNASGSSGDILQTVAYQYYTTPYLILKNNNMNIYSNGTPTTSYVIPTSYVITGQTSLDTLNIDELVLECIDGKIEISR